jgi:hypothetical protein
MRQLSLALTAASNLRGFDFDYVDDPSGEVPRRLFAGA